MATICRFVVVFASFALCQSVIAAEVDLNKIFNCNLTQPGQAEYIEQVKDKLTTEDLKELLSRASQTQAPEKIYLVSVLTALSVKSFHQFIDITGNLDCSTEFDGAMFICSLSMFLNMKGLDLRIPMQARVIVPDVMQCLIGNSDNQFSVECPNQKFIISKLAEEMLTKIIGDEAFIKKNIGDKKALTDWWEDNKARFAN